MKLNNGCKHFLSARVRAKKTQVTLVHKSLLNRQAAQVTQSVSVRTSTLRANRSLTLR